MSILIDTVRVQGFRGLANIEMSLEPITILTGMNNSGKTSILKALQIVFGNSSFITREDFNTSNDLTCDEIIIDVRIVPYEPNIPEIDFFDENWAIVFGAKRIKNDANGVAYIPLRTIVTYDDSQSVYKTKQYILKDWPEFQTDGSPSWNKEDNGSAMTSHFDELPFFPVNAQRDIIEDIKFRTSYFGKMIAKIVYPPDVMKKIETQIEELNRETVNSSPILQNLSNTYRELDSTMDTTSEGVSITLFTKKLRDLNKGIAINYADDKDSFPMEYHGMGTRSWSSLLTLKSFIEVSKSISESDGKAFFPIMAIEEPEAHLHPNAQKKLYRQLASIPGQKIISTHSPYIAAQAELEEIRNLYKNDTGVVCGNLDIEKFSSEEIRKIERQVIHTNGEIFFSKVLVFCEGETEEQALPIFFNKFFGYESVSVGIDFIGVQGNKSYLPFLRFAEELKIPWLIYSDSDCDSIAQVERQFARSGSPKSKDDAIVFLDNDNNFERQLISEGYQNEIKEAILQYDSQENDNPKYKEKKKYEIDGFCDEKLLDELKRKKTQCSPLVAENIASSGKSLPKHIVMLFEKIKLLLTKDETNV